MAIIVILLFSGGGYYYYYYTKNKFSEPEKVETEKEENNQQDDDMGSQDNYFEEQDNYFEEQDNYFEEQENDFEEQENDFEEQDYNPNLNNAYSSDEGILQPNEPASDNQCAADFGSTTACCGQGKPILHWVNSSDICNGIIADNVTNYDDYSQFEIGKSLAQWGCENYNSDMEVVQIAVAVPNANTFSETPTDVGPNGTYVVEYPNNVSPVYICPETKPYCSGYIKNQKWGTCYESNNLIQDVSEQQCADEGGINYTKCPETGITYCCNVCDGKATCPSNKDLQNCACIGELTKENSDLIGYSLMYSDMFRNFKFNKDSLWNHWTNNGKNEGRILNPILPMDDLYNQEGYPAKPMPTIPGWGLLKNDDGNVIFTDGWIWHVPMPTSTQIGDMNNLNYTQVPVDICKFYRDYNNTLGMDHPVKLYVNVDDTAWIIHNNQFIVQVTGFKDNPGIDLTLTPGKNRIMIVAYNGGGPAGLQAAMLDDVNDAPLISTAVQSSWRYINDMFNCTDLLTSVATIEGFPGDWRQVPEDEINWDGALQFSYDFNNTSGTILESKILSNFDDFGVIFVERQIIGAKGLGDPTPFYAKFRPGKTKITVCIMNYGGPGGLTLRALSMDEQTEYFSTNSNHNWCYKKVTDFYPGPIGTVTVYEHSFSAGKNFFYGDWNHDRMTSRGHPNDSMTSLKTPDSAIFTGFGDGNGSTVGEIKLFNSFFPKSDGGNLTVSNSTDRHIHDDDNASIRNQYNDKLSSFVVQTPIMDGVIMFENALGGNMYGRENHTNKGTTKRSKRYGDGYQSNVFEAGIPNDKVSSVYIPHGYTLEIFEHSNFEGQVWTHANNTQKYGYLTNVGWHNDRMSSFKVKKNDSHTYFHVFNENLLKDTREKFLEN